MKKKRWIFAGILLYCLCLTACGGNTAVKGAMASLAEGEGKSTEPAFPTGDYSTEAAVTKAETSASTEAVQGDLIDLTNENGTIIFGEIYQMMCEPEKYEGKQVKIEGDFAPVQSQEGDQQVYTMVRIFDELKCCSQGVEFVCPGKTYPQDYPPQGSLIQVTGTFETYMEGDQMYFHLVADDYQVLAREEEDTSAMPQG